MNLPPLEIFTCDQGTTEWMACRAGCVTASVFDAVLAQGRGGGESKTRRKLMLKLIGERMTGEPEESYSNGHMERGQIMEAEARSMYAMLKDVEPQKVGFLKRGEVGCSPDALIGDGGLLEIKTKLPSIQLEVLLANTLPPEHRPQCQGQLWIAEREWLDFVSYYKRMPIFIHRVYRDEEYIKTLAANVQRFLDEMHGLMEVIGKL